MVDNPDKLNRICLRKFSSLLKSDQFIWKKQIEEQVYQHYQEQTNQSTIDQQQRKHHRSESFRIDDELSVQSMDYSIIRNQTLFLEYFLHGYCPLNSILSEHLVNYLITHDQLNDFTLSIFKANVTCLKRFVINVKYLSRLQCHILSQHPNLIELEIIFKDSNSTRTIHMTNGNFYQHICPSIDSTFNDIYTIYGPFILHHKYSRLQSDSRRASASNNNNLLECLPNSSDEFSHHKLLNGIFTNLHPMTIERLKLLSLSHYKFFATTQTSAARKYSPADMSPLTKW
jgi:hypothetical protein